MCVSVWTEAPGGPTSGLGLALPKATPVTGSYPGSIPYEAAVSSTKWKWERVQGESLPSLIVGRGGGDDPLLSCLTGSMALWRAYQRALTAHPWKVQVLTAGECPSEVEPEQADLRDRSLRSHTSLIFGFYSAL